MKKSYATRLLALLLALIMAFSLGTVALADGETGDSGEAGDAEGTVTATKTLRMNEDGTYYRDADGNFVVDISVSGVPYTSESQSAADVVLVVDCSGSMSEGHFPCPGKTTDMVQKTYSFLWEEYTYYQCSICGSTYDTLQDCTYGHNQSSSRPGPDRQSGLSRMTVAKLASRHFVSSLLPTGTQNRVAVIGFSGEQGGTGAGAIDASCGLTSSADEANNIINSFRANGGTNYTAALYKAQQILNNRTAADKTRPAYVVFISDGAPGRTGESYNDTNWNGTEQAAALKTAGVQLYTIGIQLNSTASSCMKKLASAEANFVNLGTKEDSDLYAELNAVLTVWGKVITKVDAGKDAVIVDEVDLDNVSEPVLPADSPLVWDAEEGTLTWNVGNITKDAKTASFAVAPKDGVAGDEEGKLHTNGGITLTYTDTKSGEEKEIADFGDPAIQLPSVTLTKTFTGLPETAVLPEEITVTLTQSEDLAYTAVLTAEDGYTATIAGLPFGTYTVTEDGQEVDGYECAMALSGTAVDTQNNQQIVLTPAMAGTTAAVTVANTYTEKEATEGTLTVTKTVTGLQGTDCLGDDFSITLTMEDEATTSYTLLCEDAVENEGVYTWTVENVPFGTYTVAEQQADVEGYELTATVPETFDFSATNATLSLTNKYNKQITVTFVIEGGTWDDSTAANQTVTLTLNDNGVATLADADIPTGMTADDDHMGSGAWDVTPAATTELKEDTTYTYTFDAKPTTAEVTVIKTIVGLDSDSMPEKFSISVASEDTTYVLNKNGASIETDENGDAVWTWLLKDVPFGSYTVTESNADVEGYSCSVAGEYDAEEPLTLTWETAAKSVYLTNTYTTTPVRFYLVDNSITESSHVQDAFTGDDYLAVYGGYAYLTTARTGEAVDTMAIGEEVTLDEGETLKDWLDANVTSVDETELKIAALIANGTLNATDTDETKQAEAAKYDLVYETITNNNDALFALNAESGEYEQTDMQESFHVHVKLVAKTAPEPETITVTFKVVNGTWYDGTDADQTVTLTLEEGSAKLVGTQIPYNMKAAEGYEGGAWDVEPSTETALTEDTTYTYTFTEKQPEPEPETLVVEIPVAKTVVKGGKSAPGNETFTFNVTLYVETKTEYTDGTQTTGYTPVSSDSYTVAYNTIATRGAGEYTGLIQVTIDADADWDMILVTEQDDEANYWTYDGSYWEIERQWPDTDDTYVGALYATQYKDDGEPLGDGIYVDAGEAITFENTYTYSDSESHSHDDDRYTVIYESNGGTTYRNEIYAAGTTVELTKKPIRANYTFAGWYTDEDLTERATTFTMPSHNVTLYARWSTTSVPPALNGDDHFAYIVGYEDGTVRPSGNISRAEVATIFFRLLTAETRDGNLTRTNSFTDVPANAWYCAPVSTMAKLGLINGRSETTFDPNAPITRAEFAAICARFDYSVDSNLGSFSDMVGHWAQEETDRAASLGWITGYEDGTFHPDQYITRAEAMTIINRVLKRLPETTDDLHKDMTTWPDNADTDAWYYLAVQEATNSHDFARKTDDMYERWTGMSTTPDWTRYEK